MYPELPWCIIKITEDSATYVGPAGLVPGTVATFVVPGWAPRVIGEKKIPLNHCPVVERHAEASMSLQLNQRLDGTA